MKNVFKGLIISVVITIFCIVSLFAVINATILIPNVNKWYMKLDCNIYSFNETHYIYENTCFTDKVAVIQIIDLNTSYAKVFVKMNNTGLEILELIVSKASNIAWSNQNFIGFNPFYVFIPVNPPYPPVEKPFLNTTVKIKYSRKFTYKRITQISNTTEIVKYEVYDVSSVETVDSFPACIPVGIKTIDNTTYIKYEEVNISPLIEVFKAKLPITIMILLPAKILHKDFLNYIDTNANDKYILLEFEVPPEFNEEIEILQNAKVRIPLIPFIMFNGHIFTGIMLTTFTTYLLINHVKTRKNQ